MTNNLRPGHTVEGNWIKVPREYLETPHPGDIVEGPAYWLLTENDEVLFFKSYRTPQRNADKLYIATLIDRESKKPKDKQIYPPLKTAKFLALAFVPREHL